MAEPVKKAIEWDGKIPLWGILLLGLGWAGFEWGEIRALRDRALVLETEALSHRSKIAELERKIQDIGTLRGDINTLKELLIRIERKIETK